VHFCGHHSQLGFNVFNWATVKNAVFYDIMTQCGSVWFLSGPTLQRKISIFCGEANQDEFDETTAQQQ
jgi:hypothetical protein